jgi:hypothetical protein
MTEPAGALRGMTPFPEAGTGVYLQFKTADLLSLQEKFGDDWFVNADTRCSRFDMPFLMACATAGGKKDGAKHKIDFDELDCPLARTAEVILDGLYVSMHGRTYKGYVAWIMETVEAAKTKKKGGAEDPSLEGPEKPSTGSDQPLSGQD